VAAASLVSEGFYASGMVDLNTPAGAALITGFFVVVASAVVPWIREAVSERRRKREELARLIRLEVHGALKALASAPVARSRVASSKVGDEVLAEQARAETEHAFALALLAPRDGVTLSSMLLMAFSFARGVDEDRAHLAVGAASRALINWYSGAVDVGEAWEQFAESMGLPADIDQAAEVMPEKLGLRPITPSASTLK
jgi:hypothetical protein